ncbi:MAG: endonuclease NucS [Gammaproteobacteria bacterium]|nr:endonuclease NucS [Gammaproteobacteria bacterium]
MNPLQPTTFEQQGLKERQVQDMLKNQIDLVAPDTLVVAEEFADWEDSRRRIDLLGIDKNANLVVIELKRTQDGGHMELQALRYAAMISTLTFNKLISVHAHYLAKNEIQSDAKNNLLEFLEWDEPDEERFAQEVKIILVAAEFSKELTTSVMWLNDFGLDIRCVRIRPFINDGHIILDTQIIVPLPEVADYQVGIREKKRREREARNRLMDFTKFDVSIGGQRYENLGKGRMIFSVVSHILEHRHGKPGQIIDAIPATVKKANYLFEVHDGKLNSEQFREQYRAAHPADGNVRYFIKDDELFHIDGKTYAFSNQWSKDTTPEAVDALKTAFPELNINYERADSV